MELKRSTTSRGPKTKCARHSRNGPVTSRALTPTKAARSSSCENERIHHLDLVLSDLHIRNCCAWANYHRSLRPIFDSSKGRRWNFRSGWPYFYSYDAGWSCYRHLQRSVMRAMLEKWGDHVTSFDAAKSAKS